MCENQELCWHFEVIMKLEQLQIVQICQKDRNSLVEQSVSHYYFNYYNHKKAK